MQDELQIGGSPPRFSFPELHYTEHNVMTSTCCSELSSSTSTPFVSAPSSPTRSSSSKASFCFSAPTSPSWPPHQNQASDFPYNWPPPSAHHHPLPISDSSPQISHSWAQPTALLHCSAYVNSHSVSSHHTSSLRTEHHGSSHGFYSLHSTDHTRSPAYCAQQSLQAPHNRSSSPASQMSLQFSQHERASSWASQSLQTEHHDKSSSFTQKPYQTEYERSPHRASLSLNSETEYSRSSYKSLQTHHESIPSWAQQKSLQKHLQTEHAGNPLGSQASPHIKDLHAANSNLTQVPQPVITESANPKALKRLQVEDIYASYSRNSFYASAVPFSWEEKPGTPKARSITSEASNGEDDSPSNLLSGSSDFEFSARFSELEDPPMSPTPILSTFNSFKHQYAYGSPSPTHKYADHTNPDTQSETANQQQIWPLPPPPRLDNLRLQKQPIKDEADELKCSHGSLASLSAPQSPRSPRIFDLRGVLCGVSSPVDAVFDPFLAAMEKSMAKNGDDEEMGKSPKKKTNRYSHGHHRRTQSLSPLRVFHWDDHSAKSNSSSNGSSNMDEIKNKHPIQREINARHSAGAPKGSKRWSFKGFLHRKSVSGGESARHSNTSASLRSSGRESCSSSGMGEGPMDVSSVDDNMKVTRGANSPINSNPNMLVSMPSTPSSILSPSSSNNSSKGKPNTNKGSNKGPYALHYSMQRAHTEEMRKKTFLPYKQGLLGCLGLSSRSYRALATLSKPLQSVS